MQSPRLGPDGSASMSAFPASSAGRALDAERRRKLVKIVAIVVGIALAILGIGGLRRALTHHDAERVEAAPAAPREPTTSSRDAVAAPPSAPPSEAIPATPPAATTGTVVHASKRRLVIDGAVVKETSLSLPCGAHTVKIGVGNAHSVDVPCGGSITLR